MHRKTPAFALLTVAMLTAACGPKYVSLSVEPSTAFLYKMNAAGDTTRLTTSTIDLPDGGVQRIVAWAPGYKPVVRDVTAVDAAAQKPVVIKLKDRLVQVRITPPDADVTLDGQRISARTTQLVEVKEGQVRQLEAKKVGYKAISRTYANREGQPTTPEVDDVSLVQRVVGVSAMPGGTQIDINGAKYGEDFAEVAIPANGCTTVKADRKSVV